ncbi:hypothetical protein [Xenorhabdus beddingii]|uniref:hypothetical protein n=1 Tax=Xenorhabdus beddingii TaxID=40578 RepID=UPI001FC960AF|nr:hypothetical protein [Xenorhabdus beddingii]
MRGQTVTGLPVGFGVGGGKWAMGGLCCSAPVENVPAAQSPFNIMWEIIRTAPMSKGNHLSINERLNAYN